MANLKKASTRDKKRDKRKHGHRVDGRSIFVIIQIQVQKAEETHGNNH